VWLAGEPSAAANSPTLAGASRKPGGNARVMYGKGSNPPFLSSSTVDLQEGPADCRILNPLSTHRSAAPLPCCRVSDPSPRVPNAAERAVSGWYRSCHLGYKPGTTAHLGYRLLAFELRSEGGEDQSRELLTTRQTAYRLDRHALATWPHYRRRTLTRRSGGVVQFGSYSLDPGT